MIAALDMLGGLAVYAVIAVAASAVVITLVLGLLWAVTG